MLPHVLDINRHYQKQFIANKVQAEQQIEEVQGFDIVLDELDRVPTMEYSFSTLDFSNWGELLVIPENIRQRIRQECSFKVRLKISDTGLPAHPDLSKGIVAAHNYTPDPTEDKQGHSTHVFGIAMGKRGGVLWELVDKGLLTASALKNLGDKGQGSFAWAVNMIQDQREEDEALWQQEGIRVVYNMSWGGGTGVISSLEKELEDSAKANVVFVCAAGNNGGPVIYPALSQHTITASALSQDQTLAPYSNRGPEVDNAMPGSNIVSTYLNGGYASLSGTSMASPFLASAVCIAISKWGAALGDVDHIRRYLAFVAKDLGVSGEDDLYGAGIALIERILDISPAKMEEPEEPDEQPEEPEYPTKDMRELFIDLPEEYDVIWRPFNQFTNRRLRLRLRVAIESKLYADDAYSMAVAATESFFTNRGFILKEEHDFADAVFWARHFYEMLVPQDIRIIEAQGFTEDGENIVLDRRTLDQLKGKMKRLFNDHKISTYQY